MTNGEVQKRQAGRERARLIKKLKAMAFGKANDAVRLVISGEEIDSEELRELDLTMLSEIKKGASGAVEVKLINRLEVMKILLEELGRGEAPEDPAERFLTALHDAGKSAE